AWVQAYNGPSPLGGWSAGFSFSITAPAGPTLIAPTGTVANPTPTLTWNASTDAMQYDVWIDSSTQSQVIRQTVNTTSLTPTKPLRPGQYAVWIRAANSAGNFGSWSAGSGFQIDSTAPAIPT